MTRIIISVFQRKKLKRTHNYVDLVRHDTKTYSDSTNMLANSDTIKILDFDWQHVRYVWWTCFATVPVPMSSICVPLLTDISLCPYEADVIQGNFICRAMDSVPTSSSVDFWFDPRSCKPKNYTVGMCCFPSKHVSLRRKTKHWLGRNQSNEFECSIYDTINETIWSANETMSYPRYSFHYTLEWNQVLSLLKP